MLAVSARNEVSTVGRGGLGSQTAFFNIGHCPHLFRPLAWSSVALLILSSYATSLGSELQARVGEQEIIFANGYRGLQYFPDLPICIVSKHPWTYYLVAGDCTFLMQGRTFETAIPVAKVLEKGVPNSFDNGYAGIGGVYYDKANRELVALYHAEDHTEMPAVEYNRDIKGSYWSVGLAVSKDGRNFSKVGQIITGSLRKGASHHPHQGVGNVSLCPDHTGEYLFAYYGDLSRVNNRPAGVSMARSRIQDRARPGTWYKYHSGQFDEEGLGGKDTLVLPTPPRSEASMVNVQYSAALKKYIMVCSVGTFSDMGNPDRPAQESGIHFSYSDDGIRWSKPQRLFVGHVIPFNGQETTIRPSLHIIRATDRSIFGWLIYAYSPRWGVAPPNTPHHMVRRTITISKTTEASRPNQQ